MKENVKPKKTVTFTTSLADFLEEIDELLARLEDYTHGKDGEEITIIRKKIRGITKIRIEE